MRMQQSFATVLLGKSALMREGIARIIRAANFRTLASVSCADDLLASELQSYQILFLLVHTGDDFKFAVEQIGILREQYPNGRIAVVADDYRLNELISAFQAGADSYLVDVATCDAFIKSIELVMLGQRVFPPTLLSLVRGTESVPPRRIEPSRETDRAILFKKEDTTAQAAPTPQLSPREKLILRCLIEGNTNKCVARKIDIAEATVKVHVKAILRKIRVQNRTQAAIWAMNNGFLTRSTKENSLPAISEVTQALPNGCGVIAEAPAELRAVNQGANHVEPARIDGQLKGIRKAAGPGRLGK